MDPDAQWPFTAIVWSSGGTETSKRVIGARASARSGRPPYFVGAVRVLDFRLLAGAESMMPGGFVSWVT